MSKSRSRNSLLSSHNRSTFGTSSKDELLARKFSMDKPDAALYPLNDIEIGETTTTSTNPNSSTNPNPNPNPNTHTHTTYPDFKPWTDHTNLGEELRQQETQKVNNASYLNKGYFEIPMVSNEYYSARNLIQATIFSSTENCNEVLKELSQHLANAYKSRNEIINKIKYNSNKFKIPPRVTLTVSKKESWLRDLAKPEIPFSKIGEKIPHGIRNKVLVDSVCSKNVPINRAIWFTKCVLYGELVALKRKHQARLSINSPAPHNNNNNNQDSASLDKFEDLWFQEWTQQVSDYIYRFSKEISNFTNSDRKINYMNKLSYLLNYTECLYIEGLLDKNLFLSLIIKFLKEGLPLEQKHISELLAVSIIDGDDIFTESWIDEIDLNFGQRLVSLTLIKIFWNDILKLDYLCKELSESLLLNYFFIDTISLRQSQSNSSNLPKSSLPPSLKQNLITMIADTVNYLFRYNTNMFIIPNYWILVNGILVKILLENSSNSMEEDEEVSKQLELVKFRNESLILNMKNLSPSPTTTINFGNERRSSFLGSQSLSLVSPLPPGGILSNDESIFINRNPDDVFQIIFQLDLLKLNNNFASLIRPRPPSGSISSKITTNWKLNLKVVIYWCITKYRSERESNESILIICNFIKRKVFGPLNPKTSGNPKAEFENELLEIIYNIAENHSLKIDKYKLYVLINELCQLKVISIGSYLRKFIASGIFYLSPGGGGTDENIMSDEYNPLVETHLSILQNLPVINNRQFDSILKKLSSGSDLKEKFDHGTNIFKSDILDKLINNDTYSNDFQTSINYVCDLNIGIKFLLINWLTNELKITIAKSPKLIHINPDLLANLYHIYATCDNLTVFFKIVIKFLLRNEGGIIILYLDSLYLIAKLLIRHFKLLKFVAGNTHTGSDSTCYELFKLIIQTYKDFQSREFDYFRFDQVWMFVDSVFDKNFQKDEPQIAPNKKVFTNIFGKESIDSPMRINTTDIDNDRGGLEKYTPTDFRQDLDSLLQYKFQPMTISEVKDLVINLKLSVDLTNPLSLKRTALNLIENLWNSSNTKSDDVESVKLFINIRNSLGIDSLTKFNQEFTVYIANLPVENDIKLVGHFYKKLIIYEIIRMSDLMTVLNSVVDKGSFDKIAAIILDVLLGNPLIETQEFTKSQALLLKVIRRGYKDRSGSSFHHFTLKSLIALESPIQESVQVLNLQIEVMKYFNQLIVTATKLTLDEFISKISFQDAIYLLNTSLGKSSSNEFVKELKDFSNVSHEIDEFNLPMYQLLLRVICQNELGQVPKAEQKELLSFLVETFIQNLDFTFSSYNSYIGELLNFIEWDDKVCILEILESMFLKGTTIYDVKQAISKNKAIDLTNILGTINLLPVFNDFFKKFSTSSSNTVESSPVFFENLSNFLINLLDLVNEELVFIFKDDISDAISIFLRILIIHKVTLTTAIIVYDGEQFLFIKNLIALLNSQFLSQVNEKLMILLYDLLLLMKLSITQEINSLGNTDLPEPTSPGFIGGMMGQGSPTSEEQMKLLGESESGNTGGNSGGESGNFNSSSMSNLNQVTSLFNLPEPNANNPLQSYIDAKKIDSALTLDVDELETSGDFHSFNNSGLVLVSSRNDSVSLSNILGSTPTAAKSITKLEFKLRSFEILEDTSNSLNDADVSDIEDDTVIENGEGGGATGGMGGFYAINSNTNSTSRSTTNGNGIPTLMPEARAPATDLRNLASANFSSDSLSGSQPQTISYIAMSPIISANNPLSPVNLTTNYHLRKYSNSSINGSPISQPVHLRNGSSTNSRPRPKSAMFGFDSNHYTIAENELAISTPSINVPGSRNSLYSSNSQPFSKSPSRSSSPTRNSRQMRSKSPVRRSNSPNKSYQPFNFKSQDMFLNPNGSAHSVSSKPAQRKGHRYKTSSVSMNLFQEPPPASSNEQLTIPDSYPIPNFKESIASIKSNQKLRLFWSAFHFLSSLIVFIIGFKFKISPLSTLAHLVFYDALGSLVIVFVDIMSNFEVWNNSSMTYPFGLGRIEVLAGFALSSSLIMVGFDLLSHFVEEFIVLWVVDNEGEAIEQHSSHHIHAEHGNNGNNDINWLIYNGILISIIIITLISSNYILALDKINEMISSSDDSKQNNNVEEIEIKDNKFTTSSKLHKFLKIWTKNPTHFLTLAYSIYLITIPLLPGTFFEDITIDMNEAATLLVALMLCFTGWKLVKSLGGILLCSYPYSDYDYHILKSVITDRLLNSDSFKSSYSIDTLFITKFNYELFVVGLKLTMKGADIDEESKIRFEANKIIRQEISHIDFSIPTNGIEITVDINR
ncbi:uncharacterized protein RJT21DRAFT_127670 [Scheffersomyces amazonensis]|uniref:uncharacterized protein n=1 Tax=Scheffersomyces amazonensis TaxID=1078765 RepID=UPI00315D7DD8